MSLTNFASVLDSEWGALSVTKGVLGATQGVLGGSSGINSLAALPNLELWLSTKDPADILAPGNAVQLWRDKSGKSNETVLACDGTQTVSDVSGIPAFGASDFAVSVWLKLQVLGASNRYIISSSGGLDSSDLVVLTTGAVRWYSDGTIIKDTATGVITLNTLYNIVVTRTAGFTTIYVNGSASGAAAADTKTNAAAIVAIGKYAAGTSNSVGGTLQRPAIYNRALSAAEVAALYAAGGVPVTADTTTPAAGTALLTGDNSTFASGLGTWQANGSSVLTNPAANAVLTSTTTSGLKSFSNGVTLVVGQSYRLTIVAASIDSGTPNLLLAQAGSNVSLGALSAAPAAFTKDFTADTTALTLGWSNPDTTARALTIDTVTLVPLGLLAYWDFSTATRGAATVTDTSGNSCVLTTSTGARISGARDLYQGTAASQPAYDGTAQTITGDGVNDRMQSAPFTLVQPITQFDVFSMVTWTDTDVISDGFAAASGAIEQVTATPQININAGSSVAANTSLAVAVNGVVVAEFNGASSNLSVNYNAATTGNAGAGNMGGTTLFGAGGTAAKWSNVAYKEHVLFSRLMSAAEKRRVINFLIRRCAITP